MSKQDIEKRLGFAAQGVKAEMALTISTVGAKNLCYEALANLKALAQLASETNSGWDFHVTVMTDHVKNAMSQLESSPAQAGRYLERAIDTLGMLRKIEPKRLNDIQKGSFKQLIGYVAKSLRDAKANIKVVTTASRPGAKASFSNGATTNAFLSKIDAATRNKILTSIAKHYGISASQAMAEVTDADAESLLDYMTEPERSATSVLLKRHGFSRAGAKAAMAKPLRKAEPYEALYYKWFNGIQVSIMDMTKIKNDINAIIASGANPDVEMPKLVKKYGSSGFSRLGAKAKMGRPKTVTVITMMSGTGGSGGLFKVVGYDENGREFEYGMFAMRSMAEQKAKDVARWTDSKYISSHPGAKAKMGSSQVNDSATTADLIREAQRLRDVIKTSNREFDKTHLRQIKQELDRRGVLMPYGASEVLASRPAAKAKA